MKRKRTAKRKKSQKKIAITNDKSNELGNFVDLIADKISEPAKYNDDKFGEFGNELESDSQSLSSPSSGSEESFNIENFGSSNKRVKKSAPNMRAKSLPAKRGPGRPRKREVSNKATDMRAKSSMGLNPVGEEETQSNKMHRHPLYNKEELAASLAVIKKVMEMDEALPFIAPMDPVSLGIPRIHGYKQDYSDVIETPMDFGTICSNIQNGVKYLNSEDVYKDVQYIWLNCLKVNKKGDYTVYLMKRVKKKFMKYWTSVGLHSEISRKNSDHYTGHDKDKEALMNNFTTDNPSRVQKDKYSQVQKDNYCQLQKDNYGNSLPQPRPQVPQESHSFAFQAPQPSTIPLAQQFSQLQDTGDNTYAGLAHLVAYIDHAIRRSKNEASIVDNSVGNPSVMQKDNFGTSQLHSPVPPSSFGQPYQSPQPSSFQPLQLSRLHDAADSNIAGHPELPPNKEFTMTRQKATKRCQKFPPLSGQSPTKGQQHRQSSFLLQQSQQNTSQLQPFYLGTADMGNTGHSSLPIANDRKAGRSHVQQFSADHEVESPLPPQPSGSLNIEYQSQQFIKRKKGARGPTRCRDMWIMSDGDRIFVPVNTLGQPVGPKARKLASFLGTVARNGNMVPLTFPGWHAVPDEKKEEMWQFVQTKFNIDPMCKTWVLKSIASKWRNWKAKLKAEHYYPHKTDEERLKDCDKRIIPEQWPVLLSFWNSEEYQLRCEKNKANRANLTVTHTSGSKSFATIREEERAKRPDGNEPSRTDLYIITRTRKDGQPLNEKAAEIISKLNEQSAQKPQTLTGSNEWEDAFCKVVGRDKCAQISMYGLSPTPDNWCQKTGMRIASEGKRAANEDVSKMVAKVEAMEQKYASMEAQIARMTSSMQNFLDKLSVSSKVPRAKQVPKNLNAHEDSVQENSDSLSSSHGIPCNEDDYQDE